MAVTAKTTKRQSPATRKPHAFRFDSPEQEAFLSLWRTYDRLRAFEDELFAQFDLTPQQYNILRLVAAEHPARLPTLEIASRLVSRAPDITRMLDKLEQHGFVVRERTAADRRTVRIGITTAGSALVARIAVPLAVCHRKQLGHMKKADLATLATLLREARRPHEPDTSVWR